MGLFGGKRTGEEILEKGRALFDQGKYGKACLTLLKASGELNGEVDYWLGRCYLAVDEKKGNPPSWTAKNYLKLAAKAGHEEAVRLLEKTFGIQHDQVQDTVLQTESTPAQGGGRIGGEDAATLHYRTRAGSTPRGKPRIYFCCHPEDFSLWFEPLARELLELWDCAVWYASGVPRGREAEEELADSLTQMQLFVIPISEAFLHEESHARAVEFALAQKHHIPVLPILVNGGLAADFNRICGNLQFLDRTSVDVTEIPYGEKLKKFLTSLLVTEDLVERVREAFDAYVFLSYRKKDRKYAQELMRLIHENQFCRDIAIWYDEFLIPGENFNAAIQDALAKSRLFALAVTPNLVNEKNYVMDIEYPMALQTGKKILAAELCPTDRGMLEQCYADIPNCVDSHDADALSVSLMDSLREVAVSENDSSPQHLLFIGLAYLGGIDVEVNPRRGVELITQAAEGGLPQAMEKLVSLYRTGGGVPLNQDQAIAWQVRLVAAREEELEKTGQGGEALLDSLQLLTQLYLESQQYLPGAEACQRLHQKLTTLGDQLDRGTAMLYTLWYHDTMGIISQEQGLLARAREEFRELERHAVREWEEEGTADALYHILGSCQRQGELSLTEGNLEQALTCFQRGKELAERADKQLNSVISMSRCLVAGLKCAEVLCRQDNLSRAEKVYEELLPLAQRLAEDGTPQHREMLAQCYQSISDLYVSLGKYQKAQACERQSLSLARQMAEQAPSIHNLRRLLGDELRWGDLLFRLNPVGTPLPLEFLECYEDSLKLARNLVERTGSSQAWLDLAMAQDRMSRYHAVQGDEEREAQCLIQAVEAAEHGVNSSGGVEAMRALSDYLGRLAQMHGERGDEEQDGLCRERRIRILKDIGRESQSMEDQVALALGYYSMSIWSQGRGECKTALEQMTQATQICERAVELEPTVTRYRNILADCYGRMEQLCRETGGEEEARQFRSKGLKLAEEVQGEDTSVQARRSLAARYQKLGDSHAWDRDWNQAWPYYRRYVEIYVALAGEEGSSERLVELRDAWMRCSASAQECGKYTQAKEFALRGCSVGTQAFELDRGSLATYDSLLHSYKCVVELCLLQNEFDQGEHYAGVYCEMCRQLPKLFPNTATYMGKGLREYAGTRIRIIMQTYEERAEALKEQENYDLAVEAYEGAIRCGDAFLELFPGDLGGRYRLARLYYHCGDVWPDSYLVYYMRKSLELWEELEAQEPDRESFVRNAEIVREIVGNT